MANHGPFASVWESLLPSLVLFLDFFRKRVGAEHYLEDPSNPNKGQLETFQEVSITTNHWSCFIPLLHGRVTGVVITMESKIVIPWCSLPKSQMGLCHHDSSLALSGLQNSPAKGPVPMQEDQYFHDLCTKGLLIPRVTFSLCSKIPANSRKPLLFYLISLAALLIFSSNLKSLSATLMQKQTYDYLRRKRSQITQENILWISLCSITWFLAVSSSTHTTLTSSQGPSGLYKRVATQQSSVGQAMAFTSGIYKPWLTAGALYSLDAWWLLSGLSTNSGAGTRFNVQLSDYKRESGIFFDPLIYSWNPVGHQVLLQCLSRTSLGFSTPILVRAPACFLDDRTNWFFYHSLHPHHGDHHGTSTWLPGCLMAAQPRG